MLAVQVCLLAALSQAIPAGAAGQPAAEQVAQAIASRRAKVAEFQLIKEAAAELGVRVWLFGGTAAGFAHYVRWDLEREGGDPRYRDAFFDYDFTNIYRSTQDADLVVDGTPEQARALERLIKEKMSFLQGSKEHWEVRLLREDRTTPAGQVKQALLHNPDFLGQHTDSNSTGMVELTDPPPGETVVRDLRDWMSPEPIFLQDLAAGRLHYYWSETHQQTTRFLEGHNPPLFSVIRYLVKAFQYGLAIEGQDRARIRQIIDHFDPGEDPTVLSEWGRGWLERYGPNLIRHAVDIERAWNTLEELGLRQRLIAFSDPTRQGSLGWWLSREPLRTWPLGEGEGPTAAELGITTVAHETREFVDYESITRDMTGRPNVLVSRPGHPGENAVSGAGFYTRLGRAGAAGTGLTVRFTLAPEAREGPDFTVHGEYLVITNRAALRVIPESLDLSFPDLLQLLREEGIDPADRGVWMKLQRRIRIRPLSGPDEVRAVEIALAAAEELQPSASGTFLTEWLSHPLAGRHPEVLDRFSQAVDRAIRAQKDLDHLLPLLKLWFGDPVSQRYPRLKTRFARVVARETRIMLLSTRLARMEGGSWLEELTYRRAAALKVRQLAVAARKAPREGLEMVWHREDRGTKDLLWDWFSLPVSTEHPELVRALIEDGDYDAFVLSAVFGRRPEWGAHPELLLRLTRHRGSVQSNLSLVVPFLKKAEWSMSPQVLQRFLEAPGHPLDEALARILEGEPSSWLARREVVRAVIDHASWDSFQRVVRSRDQAPVPGKWIWEKPPLEEWMEGKLPLLETMAFVLGRAEWADHPELVQALIEALPPRVDAYIAGRSGAFLKPLLRKAQWSQHPELVLAWVRRTDSSWDEEIGPFLQEEPWYAHPVLLAGCGGKRVEPGCLRASPPGPSPVAMAQEVMGALRSPPSGERPCQ